MLRLFPYIWSYVLFEGFPKIPTISERNGGGKCWLDNLHRITRWRKVLKIFIMCFIPPNLTGDMTVLSRQISAKVLVASARVLSVLKLFLFRSLHCEKDVKSLIFLLLNSLHKSILRLTSSDPVQSPGILCIYYTTILQREIISCQN